MKSETLGDARKFAECVLVHTSDHIQRIGERIVKLKTRQAIVDNMAWQINEMLSRMEAGLEYEDEPEKESPESAYQFFLVSADHHMRVAAGLLAKAAGTYKDNGDEAEKCPDPEAGAS